MMTNSYREALVKLEKAQAALNSQNVSDLPATQLVSLEKSKAAVYGEMQALQAQQIAERDGDYSALTTEFRDCKSDLTDLSGWISAKEARDRALFSMLAKGVSIALSLLM
jgi:hypothetical protein